MAINWNFPENNYSEWHGISEAGIETFRGKLFASLAKEICQNSLDAQRIKNIPVGVEFFKLEIETKKIPGYEKLRNALKRCLFSSSDEKARKFFENACEKIEKEKITVLRISDFNTTGLLGSKSTSTKITPWLSLIKSSGISNKTGMSGGSYGIGKSAPFACSELRTIFYTTYDTEGVLATQGVARLISFLIDNDENDKFTQGIGYYGDTDKNTPIFEEIVLDENFRRKGQTGTDLYIIGFLENKNWEEELVVAILDNFLISIYKRNLIVKINQNVLSQKTLLKNIIDYGINKKKKYQSIWDYYRVLKATDSNEVSAENNENLEQDNQNGENFTNSENEKIKIVNDEIDDMDLGNCFVSQDSFLDLGDYELRILYGDFNRQMLMARSNGMKIFDLKNFKSFLHFSAIFTLVGEDINKYFREMETPQHDNWEPDRHSDKNAKNVLRELKKMIRDKIMELGKNKMEDRMDMDGIGEYLPDNTIFVDRKRERERTEKISNKTKNLAVEEIESVPNRKNVNKDIEETNRNITDEKGSFANIKMENEKMPFDKNGEISKRNLQKEFSIMDDENGIIDIKKIDIVSNVENRVILINKKMRKYKLVILPKKDIEKGSVKISLSGEQASVKAKIRDAYENDDFEKPLRIKQDKIYIEDLKINQKFSLTFILNYSDECSMEVDVYEYRT